jgi:hypothetical protein
MTQIYDLTRKEMFLSNRLTFVEHNVYVFTIYNLNIYVYTLVLRVCSAL